MKTYSEIKAEAQKLQDLAASIRAAVASETATIDKIQGDKSRSEAWKLAEIAAVRKDSKVTGMFNELRSRHTDLIASQDLWVTPFYALARERILPGPADATLEASEAAVRMNFREELRMMEPHFAKLIVAQAAMQRDWGRVFQGVLVLKIDGVPFSLDALPIPSVDAASELFYNVEASFRQAAIDVEGLAGTKSSSSMIALGLLTSEYRRRKAARQRGWVLNLDEKKMLGMDKPQTLQDALNPKPMNITLPVGVPDAGFKREKSFEPIQPGEIPE